MITYTLIQKHLFFDFLYCLWLTPPPPLWTWHVRNFFTPSLKYDCYRWNHRQEVDQWSRRKLISFQLPTRLIVKLSRDWWLLRRLRRNPDSNTRLINIRTHRYQLKKLILFLKSLEADQIGVKWYNYSYIYRLNAALIWENLFFDPYMWLSVTSGAWTHLRTWLRHFYQQFLFCFI